jgi:cysteine-rich repeat protein
MVDTDDCTNACQMASCGDGVLWEGVEICDDGNLANNDMCPGSCAPAFCGDGYTLSMMEQCDDANMVDDDFCHNDCTTNGFYDDFESNTLMTLPWMTSGDALWSTLDTAEHQGVYGASSGDIDDYQVSDLELTLMVPADGAVMFWYKVGSEEGYDYLYFYIDDVQQGDGWSGQVAWAQANYPVTTGVHTFKWSYSKDGSLTYYEDAAWIDEVFIGIPP